MLELWENQPCPVCILWWLRTGTGNPKGNLPRKAEAKGSKGRGAKGNQMGNATNAQRRMAAKAQPGAIPEEADGPQDPTPGDPTANAPGAAPATTKPIGARIKSYQQALAIANQSGDIAMAATPTKTLDGFKSEQVASRPLHRRITSAEINLEGYIRLVNEVGSEVHDLETQIKETRTNLDNARKRKILAQTCVYELRKDLDTQSAANAQTNAPKPAAAADPRGINVALPCRLAGQAKHLQHQRGRPEGFAGDVRRLEGPGAPASATPADAQTQIYPDLKTHRLKFEAE